MKKLFLNDKFYSFTVVLAAIGGILELAYNKIVVDNGVFDEAPLFLSAICSIFIYTSYKKHSKNVMKGMMGALLAGLLIYSFNLMSSLSVDALSITALVAFILTLLIFINHFIINAEHQASPQSVFNESSFDFSFGIDRNNQRRTSYY